MFDLIILCEILNYNYVLGLRGRFVGTGLEVVRDRLTGVTETPSEPTCPYPVSSL